MKKWLIPLIILGVIAFGLYSWAKGFYNSAIKLEEPTKEAWAKVESSYQRRNDLVGNLLKIVEGSANYEKGTLKDVIEARAKATSVNIDPTNVTPEQLASFNEAQSGLTGALSRLLVTVERYPDLKANQNFSEFQSQYEGTENRINVARDRFNETIRPYNEHIKTFPNNVLANIFNLNELSYFEAESGAEKAPELEFNIN